MGGSSGIAIVDDLNPVHAGGAVNRAVESPEGHIIEGAALVAGGLYAAGAFAPAAGAGAAETGAFSGAGYLSGDAAATSTAGYLGTETSLGYGAASAMPVESSVVSTMGAANSYDLAASVGSPAVASWSGAGNAAAAASANPGFWSSAGTILATGVAGGLGTAIGNAGKYNAASPEGKPGAPGFVSTMPVGSRAPSSSGPTSIMAPAAASAGISATMLIGVVGLIYFMKKSKQEFYYGMV